MRDLIRLAGPLAFAGVIAGLIWLSSPLRAEMVPERQVPERQVPEHQQSEHQEIELLGLPAVQGPSRSRATVVPANWQGYAWRPWADRRYRYADRYDNRYANRAPRLARPYTGDYAYVPGWRRAPAYSPRNHWRYRKPDVRGPADRGRYRYAARPHQSPWVRSDH